MFDLRLQRLLLVCSLMAASCSDGGGPTAPPSDNHQGLADVSLIDDASPEDVVLADAPSDTVSADDASPGQGADAPSPEDAQERDAQADAVVDEDVPNLDDEDAPVPDDASEPESGTWQSRAPIAAGPRQEVSVVALNGEVYVIGGFNDTRQVQSSMEVYNPATDTWRTAASLPVRLHHANAAVVDGKLYVLGFLTGLNFTADGRAFVYDPATETWEPRAPMPTGRQRGASGTAAIDGQIYVSGGLRGGAVQDFSVYDPAEDRWQALPDHPLPLDHLVVGAIDGIFYTFGGRDRSIRSHTDRVFAYDPVEGQWSERASMPTSRAGHAAAVVDGVAYVLGGEGNPNHPSQVFDENEAYDPRVDRWTSLPAIPTRRHGTGAAAVDGIIHLPGGADVIAFGAITTHESYAP